MKGVATTTNSLTWDKNEHHANLFFRENDGAWVLKVDSFTRAEANLLIFPRYIFGISFSYNMFS